ncbi:MAG: UDP-glucose dehydrogenase family protein [Actinomycetota bacterium]
MRIAVVGTGYVGLVTGACFAELGHQVACVDNDPDKVAKLRQGTIPFHEPGLPELVAKHIETQALRFTTDLREGSSRVDAVFICVPTPQGEDGQADTSAVESVASDLAHHIDPHTVIVNKSTVPVGSAHVVERIVRRSAPAGFEFAVASNPEFLREGSAVYDFLHPDRVVVGTSDERAVQVLTDLYRPLAAPVLVVSPETAELIKYASNAFLATKVSFINAIARICDAVGADVQDVALGMGYDPRIGFEFLRPGPGFGGSCFPKDCAALISAAGDRGYDFGLLRGVLQVNDAQRGVVIDKLERAVGDLSGKRIGVWGLAFKANTDDTRESPALKIVQELVSRNARVVAYDPVVPDEVYSQMSIDRASSAVDAADGADAVLVLTEWDEFRWLDMSDIAGRMRSRVIVDARNALDPALARGAGFEYAGIGR